MITVPKNTTRLHPLSIATLEKLKNFHEDSYGMYDTSRFPILSLRVSKKSLNRAIKILNRLIKQAEKKGYNVTIEKLPHSHSYYSYIKHGKDKIQFKIIEKSTRCLKKENHNNYSNRYEYEQDGTLYLAFTNILWTRLPNKWIDKPDKSLEYQMDSIFEGMIKVFAKLEARRLEDLESNLKWEEQRKDLNRAEELKKRKLERIKKLEEDVNNYHKAIKIRTYIDYIKSNHSLEAKEYIQFAEDYLLELENFKL